MSINPILHARTKHIKLDYHYIREHVALGALLTQFVSSSNQLANIFTKPLSKVQFQQNDLLYSATQLHEAGVKFEVVTSECCFDIKFEKRSVGNPPVKIRRLD